MDKERVDSYRHVAAMVCRIRYPAKLDEEGDALLKSIEDAFFSWPHQGNTWVQGEMIDCHEEPDVLAAGTWIGSYRCWQEVPPGLFAAFPSAYRYLDLKGKLFYLPALMKWNLLFGRASEVVPADTIEEEAIIAELSEHLNDEQRAVYQRYLEYERSMPLSAAR